MMIVYVMCVGSSLAIQEAKTAGVDSAELRVSSCLLPRRLIPAEPETSMYTPSEADIGVVPCYIQSVFAVLPLDGPKSQTAIKVID
jgi:hypothetical protein